jgi:tetratricopeptide (TPR) repeat protein
VRKVALKIIKLGMDTRQVLGRFEAERQALALMDHPNIARVFDAGTTDSGRPYFAMELVRGVKITDYCNQNHLDVVRRLTLFVQVCHAIQHAHQKRIIHRDIKPSNILVELQDGAPQPKVIDFGIAKTTGPRLTDNTQFTAGDQFMGTPAYMSPEQADRSGGDVDTRSDIYSLGVLLYELLTGRTPFDSKELGQSGMDEWRRTLREREPRTPSALLTVMGQAKLAEIARERHSEPLRLISTVRGDLDWIVMKALEKSPARRYETAGALAADVLRYLNNEPVEARPPSRIYRFQKLVRRNRVVFAAIAAVSIALVTGFGTSTWLFLQERQARQRAVEAEKQQIRMRQESDLLRQQAEFRERLTQAAVARSHDKLDEADRLLVGIPAPEQNLEYAMVYRTVGDWHAFRGRWKQALERFSVLMLVNQSDDPDATAMDYLRYAPLLLETGDTNGYQKFRELAVARFAGTNQPVAAERVIKVSLLTPAGGDFLEKLQPLALTASNSLAGTPPPDEWGRAQAAWRAFSMALLEYRRGNYPEMERWYQKSRQYQDFNDVRSVTFRILLAMSHFQQGAIDQSRLELASVRQRVEGEFKRVETAPKEWSAFWFDWVFARILLREAMVMTSSADQ